jgi:hypothetical protein
MKRLLVILLVTVAISAGFVVGRVSADQPHMQTALDNLRMAKHELELAVADKGGHREAALRLTNDAIAQVEKGIEWARHH